MTYHYNQREIYTPPKQNLSVNEVTNAACNWLVSEVEQHSNLSKKDSNLQEFKKEVFTFLKDSLQRLNCANLRTTAYNSKLYQIARRTNIPCDALPANISIIVTPTTAYYIAPARQKLPIFP